MADQKPATAEQTKIKPILGRAAAIVGPSGRGKSTSIRNLPKANTAVLNWEQKRMPFKGQDKFPQYLIGTKSKGYDTMEDLLKISVANPALKIIVHDSFSAFLDIALAEAKMMNEGWDVWTAYNGEVARFFKYMKRMTAAGLQVFVLAHDEIVPDMEGIAAKRIKVKGNEWKGVIEKEFDVMLYSTAIPEAPGKNRYVFHTQTDGKTPAKTPMGMFEEYEIPNDLNIVYEAIKKYDGLK